jgi:hypothetical protein
MIGHMSTAPFARAYGVRATSRINLSGCLRIPDASFAKAILRPSRLLR